MSTPSARWWHALNLCLDSELWRLGWLGHEPGGAEAIFRMPEDRLAQAGVSQAQARALSRRRPKLDVDAEWARLGRLGIQAIAWDDPSYPARLKETHSAPPLIYVRGDAGILSGACLAVVGSRKLTPYGRQAIESLVPPLTGMGVTVVSGMALGADAAALVSCLESGGQAVGVLASSLDYPEVAPQSNFRLAQRIERHGCLISENPPGRPAYKAMFPQRNRIVSGLSQGVLVAEAALASGSLITARLALDQDREVFAVPGSIFSAQSAGCLDLIRRGAKCVSSAGDIAREFGWDLEGMGRVVTLDDPAQAAVASAFDGESESVQSLVERTRLPASEVMAALAELEIRGVVSASGNGLYVKIR